MAVITECIYHRNQEVRFQGVYVILFSAAFLAPMAANYQWIGSAGAEVLGAALLVLVMSGLVFTVTAASARFVISLARRRPSQD